VSIEYTLLCGGSEKKQYLDLEKLAAGAFAVD